MKNQSYLSNYYTYNFTWYYCIGIILESNLLSAGSPLKCVAQDLSASVVDLATLIPVETEASFRLQSDASMLNVDRVVNITGRVDYWSHDELYATGHMINCILLVTWWTVCHQVIGLAWHRLSLFVETDIQSYSFCYYFGKIRNEHFIPKLIKVSFESF